MRRFLSLFLLALNFVREVVVSGWVTARLILVSPACLRSGYIRFHYGDLPDEAASLLAALVTLTPGTTVVEIDLQRREYHMHLLDLDQAEAAESGIRRRFLVHVRALWGVSK